MFDGSRIWTIVSIASTYLSSCACLRSSTITFDHQARFGIWTLTTRSSCLGFRDRVLRLRGRWSHRGRAAELFEGVGHEGESVAPAYRRNQQVVAADRSARAREIGTNSAVLVCALVIERDADQRLEKSVEAREHPRDAITLARAVK